MLIFVSLPADETKLSFKLESISGEEAGGERSKVFILACTAFSQLGVWNMLISGGCFTVVSAT